MLKKYKALNPSSKYFILTNIFLTFFIVVLDIITRQIYATNLISAIAWGYIASAFFLVILEIATVWAVLSIEKNAKLKEKSQVVFNQMILAGELSALVNHEFKNILTILEYPIRNLKKSLGPNADEAVLNSIEKIQNTFERFNELTRAFGSISKHSDLKMERLVVTDAIIDVAYFIEFLAKKRAILFTMDFKPSDKNLTFVGNRVLFTQTLLNLLKNSCDAVERLSADSRWVRLEIDKQNEYVYFNVVDGGRGLVDEVKKKLFQERITTKGSNGSGLGLNISKMFTTIQGGNIEYDEKKENTTFTVTLKAG